MNESDGGQREPNAADGRGVAVAPTEERVVGDLDRRRRPTMRTTSGRGRPGPVDPRPTRPDDVRPPDPSHLRPSNDRIGPRRLRSNLVCADAAAVFVGFTVSLLLQSWMRPVDGATFRAEVILSAVCLPLWLAANAATKLYRARSNLLALDEFRNIVVASSIGIGWMVGLSFAVGFDDLQRSWVVLVFVSVVGALAFERRLARHWFRRLRATGRIARRVLIIGCDTNAIELAHRLTSSPAHGYEPVGFIGDTEIGTRAGLRVLGTLDEIEQIAEITDSNGVMISLHSVDSATINHLTRRLTDAGLHVTLSSSLRDIQVRRLLTYEVDGQAMLYIEPTIRTGWRLAAKWVFDRAIAVLGLLIALPVLGIAALLIKLDSPGPVLFKQVRVGRNGERFEMLKLRTMVANAEDRKAELLHANEMDGPMFKMDADPRITRVGRFLRKLSIDELPQFWNVLRGDMSIVGPRPALPSEVVDWTADLHERLRVLPGITGMWQVSGRSNTSFEEYKRLDLYYVDNWSLFHDVCIVAKTVGVVLRCRGAK